MEQISIFEMLKIGVGPSSSHTLGPWIASQRFIKELIENKDFNQTSGVSIELYGSLSMTGIGHATDKAIVLGLLGEDPISIDVKSIDSKINNVIQSKKLNLNNELIIDFDFKNNISFEDEFLPFHPNGLKFSAVLNSGQLYVSTYYSIGGGFVVKEGDDIDDFLLDTNKFPYPIANGDDLIAICDKTGKKISTIVLENELTLKSDNQINADLLKIWDVMTEAIYTGCHTAGYLPGNLNVKRRAHGIHAKLMPNEVYDGVDEWLKVVRGKDVVFKDVVNWISCFALGVNEVNASLGRVVTAPTNGSAGVIPAVLLYYISFVNKEARDREIINFLSVAGEIGSIFKKGATISAALGGCQAEIGVSSSMAAGALVELLGGTPEQVLIGAEIAMEHHLGLTCDPVNGLVQVPCIERNAMGAIKAVTAAEMALNSNPKDMLVSLDDVIKTMWETAQDMNLKYKETSTGGLAVSINNANC